MKYFAVIIILVFILGCAEQPILEEETQLKGVSLSPRSFQGADFTNFFSQARQAGDVITWAGDWKQLTDLNSAPYVLQKVGTQHNYIPIMIPTFFQQDTGELLRPLSMSVREEYKESTLSFVKEYQPRYIGLGIEINALFEKSPLQFEEYIEFYNDVYFAIKEVSPETKVFTVFQLERMKGLHGGLFGGENNPEKLAQWQLLRKAEGDVMAFTTYPGLIYKHPADIPEDYYTEILQYTEKPIVFTEIGWFREGPEGWESSEQEQAEFIERFFSLTEEVKPELLIWSFFYDPGTEQPFGTMGLLSTDASNSLALEAWKDN